jgi:hypothetical protein
MRRRVATLVWLSTIGCSAMSFAAPVRAQETTPAPEKPGEDAKDNYLGEMNNMLWMFQVDMDRLTDRAELVGEAQRPLLMNARREFEESKQKLRRALAAVAAAGPFTWEEKKPAADAAAAALEAAYRKALAAME